jgi:hypothetical protein
MSNLKLVQSFYNDSSGSINPVYIAYFTGNSTSNFCYCQGLKTCIRQSAIRDPHGQDIFAVPGMVVACYPLEATLKSTLTCFFNQTCINEVRSILNRTSSNSIELNTVALDHSLLSRYSSETKIEEIINQLMIDNLTWNASHERYYANCQPSKCYYTINSRNNPVYVLTTILGLIGGLSSVLQVTIPRLVTLGSKMIKWLCRCNQRRNEIQPM